MKGSASIRTARVRRDRAPRLARPVLRVQRPTCENQQAGNAVQLRYPGVLGQLNPLGARRAQMLEPGALALLQLIRNPLFHRCSRICVPIARPESLGRIRRPLPDGVRGSRTLDPARG